jgi:hypothetical protein
MCKQKIATWIVWFILDLHHTEINHSSVVDWIKLITLKKHNTQLFGATERILDNILKNAIIVSNMTCNMFGWISAARSNQSHFATVLWTVFPKSVTVRCIWMNFGRTIENGRFGLLATIPSLQLQGQLQRTRISPFQGIAVAAACL